MIDFGLLASPTLPAAHNAAHCASASHGAETKGTPIKVNNVLQSSLCCDVTYIPAVIAK